MSWAFGFGLVLLGGAAWWLMRRTAAAVEGDIAAARTWPSVDGVITRSRLMRTRQRGGLYPAIRYRYEVGGRTYHSGRLLFGGFSGGAADAEAFVAARPRGATVKVFHDPVSPRRAVLVPDGDADAWRSNAYWTAGALSLSGLLVAFLARP